MELYSGEEHDAREATRLYKETISEDVQQFGGANLSVHPQTKNEHKVAERVSAYRSGDVSKVACIDKLGGKWHKWTEHHRSIRKTRFKSSGANTTKSDDHLRDSSS